MTFQHNCECDQCESLREENDKLKKQLSIAISSVQWVKANVLYAEQELKNNGYKEDDKEYDGNDDGDGWK